MIKGYYRPCISNRANRNSVYKDERRDTYTLLCVGAYVWMRVWVRWAYVDMCDISR